MWRSTFWGYLLSGLAVPSALLGCESGGDANQTWSRFALCLAGDGVSDANQVPGRLRSIELTERLPPGAGDVKSQWPGRCASPADALYKSLDSGAEHKLLKRALTSQLGCKDEEEPGCTFAQQGSVLGDATAVWQAAKSAGLSLDAAVDVQRPKYDVAFEDASKWTSLATPEHELADSYITTDGRLRLLFKSRKQPNRICDVRAGEARCKAVSSAVPTLSYQSISLLKDDEPAISGLTEEGRKAFSTDSGADLPFFGAGESARREGVLVEQGEAGQGFAAVFGASGRKRAEAKFEAAVLQDNPPIGVGAFVSWVEARGEHPGWRFASVVGKALKEAANFAGDFPGYLYPCSSSDGQSAGIWGRRKGERDAKPTADKDANGKPGTAVFASFLQGGTWSKPVTATIPFERSFTGWRCGGDEISVFWSAAEGNQLEVGQVVCKVDGCKVERSSWPGFNVNRWLLVGDVGGKFAALWTTELGDTRRRVGGVVDFSNAEERVLFEEQERGGPVFRQARHFFVGNNAYLLVFDQGPILLQMNSKGELSSVSAK